MSTETKLEQREIVSINEAEYNPRKMRPSSFQKLKDSIDRFGLVDPLVINSRSDVLVGGHQRLRACRDLGWETVPVIYVDLDENEEKALNVALNNSEISGDWDTPKLAEVLRDLKGTDVLTATGFDEHQIAAFFDRVKTGTEEPVYPLVPKLLEHYDYVIVFATHETDWMNLHAWFELQTESSYKKKKIGVGHVVPFEKFMELLEEKAVAPPVAEPKEASKDD